MDGVAWLLGKLVKGVLLALAWPAEKVGMWLDSKVGDALLDFADWVDWYVHGSKR